MPNSEPRAPKPWALQKIEDAFHGLILICCAIVGLAVWAVISLVNWVDNGVQQFQLRNVLSPANIEWVALYENHDKAVRAMEAKYLPLRMTTMPLFISHNEEMYELDPDGDEPAYPGLPVPQLMIVVLTEDGDVNYADFIYEIFKHPNASEKLENWLASHSYSGSDTFNLSNLSDHEPYNGGHINRHVDNKAYIHSSIKSEIMMRHVMLRSGHRVWYDTFQTPDKEGFAPWKLRDFLAQRAK